MNETTTEERGHQSGDWKDPNSQRRTARKRQADLTRILEILQKIVRNVVERAAVDGLDGGTGRPLNQ